MNQNFSDSSINSNCSRWNSAILRQYIVLFPSSRSLAIVLSYNEEVNLKVSLNIFLDSPFPLVEITISLSCHSVICLHSRNVEQQTLQAHYKLMLYFVFSIHSGGDRWLELAVFLPKKCSKSYVPFFLSNPFSSRIGWSHADHDSFSRCILYPLLNFVLVHFGILPDLYSWWITCRVLFSGQKS